MNHEKYLKSRFPLNTACFIKCQDYMITENSDIWLKINRPSITFSANLKKNCKHQIECIFLNKCVHKYKISKFLIFLVILHNIIRFPKEQNNFSSAENLIYMSKVNSENFFREIRCLNRMIKFKPPNSALNTSRNMYCTTVHKIMRCTHKSKHA